MLTGPLYREPTEQDMLAETEQADRRLCETCAVRGACVEFNTQSDPEVTGCGRSDEELKQIVRTYEEEIGDDYYGPNDEGLVPPTGFQ